MSKLRAYHFNFCIVQFTHGQEEGVENLCLLKMRKTGGKRKVPRGLMYDDDVGTWEWQFLWLVPRVYFEALSKLI